MASNQVRFGPMDRRIESNGVLAAAQELGVTIIAYSPLAVGVLSGKFHNEPETLARGRGLYMRFARVGAGDTHVGAELVAKWYERNIHIFANIQHLAEPGERIVVIIGSGHAPILRELIA